MPSVGGLLVHAEASFRMDTSPQISNTNHQNQHTQMKTHKHFTFRTMVMLRISIECPFRSDYLEHLRMRPTPSTKEKACCMRAKLPVMTRTNPDVPVPTDAEVDALLANPVVSRGMRFAILCAADAGLRCQEFLHAKPDWFDKTALTVTIPAILAKDRRTRTVTISQRLADLFGELAPTNCLVLIKQFRTDSGSRISFKSLRLSWIRKTLEN